MKLLGRVSRVVVVSLIGGLLITAGIVMLITPGPGLLAIAAGLAVLAREFAWAHRVLEWVRSKMPWRDRRRSYRFDEQPVPEIAPTAEDVDRDDAA